MTSLINNLLHNDLAVILTGVTAMITVPTIVTYWYKSKKAAMDADLKMKMLEMGMTAQDIERVLHAGESSEVTRAALENGRRT